VTAMPMHVMIDFQEPSVLNERSEQVKQMVDAGLMMAEIAQKLGLHRNQVTFALQHWYATRGTNAPDGRTRRSMLIKKHLTPPLYQAIAPKVIELMASGKLLYTIAKELNVDRNTVTQAIDWWYRSQNLPVPDGRTRRKDLDHKGKPYNRPGDNAARDGLPLA
jgi:DNA-binding NarL/FixJ family response regulator